jgi:N-acetyl-1-D-myo-inositol-2-amino-2-deoxy-alpha-D-glucopyranoside deacetylase
VPFFVITSGATRARLMTVDVSRVLDRKRAALEAHRSQLTVTGDEFVTPGGAVEPIAAVEYFRRYPPTGAFDESGWATKLATTILAAFLGVVVGAVLTVVLDSTLAIASVTVPWGLIAAVVLSLSLIAGLRLVFESRVVAAVAAVGMFGSAAVMALTTPVGPALDNPLVVLLAIGLPIIAFVMAWPLPRRVPRGKVVANAK